MKAKLPRIGKAARSAINYNAANNGTVEDLQYDFRTLLFHLLGVHDKCRAYFCKYAQAEELKKHEYDSGDDDFESDSDDEPSLSDEPVLDHNTTDEFNIVYNDPLWKKMMAIMEDMAEKAQYFIEGSTSNRPESVFSSVAKFVGGKRIYYGSRGEYYRRATCGFIQYNEGFSWQLKLFENFIGRNPYEIVNDYIETREKKHESNVANSTSRNRIRGKSNRTSNANSYRPDYERELTAHITDNDRKECILRFQVSKSMFKKIFSHNSFWCFLFHNLLVFSRKLRRRISPKILRSSSNWQKADF